MTLASDIPEDIAEIAAILMDDLRNISDDLEYTARVIMAVEASRDPVAVGLSAKHADTLAFVEGFIDRNGYSPSYGEICVGLGLSSRSAAHRRVQQLIARGALRQTPGRTHSLVVVRNRDVSTAHKNSEVA